MRALVALGLTALLAVGCQGKSEEHSHERGAEKGSPPAAVDTSAPAATTAAAAAPAPAAAANQVPTEEDYEDKATTAITPANADSELSKLEKEIGP